MQGHRFPTIPKRRFFGAHSAPSSSRLAKRPSCRFRAHAGALAALAATCQIHSELPPDQLVDLQQAIALAVERSPQAQLLAARLDAADGQMEQAETRPNPVMGAELENVLGTGDFKGLDQAELTLGLTQLFEARAKRKARAAVAESGKTLLRRNFEIALAELRHAVSIAFSKALVAQQNVELQSELLHLAQSSETEIDRRAQAATASSIELAQARLATRRQAFALSQAERRLLQAKTELAALWSAPDPTGFTVVGDILLGSDLPSLADLQALLPHAPDLARFEAEKRTRQAILEREQAEAKADFELFGGVKYLRDKEADAAFVVGIDIPWKIRDRNQGNIRSARAELQAVEAQRVLALREARIQLANAYREIRNAQDEWSDLAQTLLPAAEQALAETEAGYDQGVINLLNVLDARRSLFEIRAEMLQAAQQYLAKQAEIARLTQSSKQ